MYDMRPYLSRFFTGPYPDRRSAILGVVGKGGERSMVVGFHDGSWWAQPWRSENFHPEKWPDGFEFVDSAEADIVHVRSKPFRMSMDDDRLDTIRSIFGRSRREAVTEDFDFANWLTDEDFKVRFPEPPEDVRIAANLAGDDDDIFFRLIAEMPKGIPGNFSSRKDRRS